jgi:hypothetical protein
MKTRIFFCLVLAVLPLRMVAQSATWNFDAGGGSNAITFTFRWDSVGQRIGIKLEAHLVYAGGSYATAVAGPGATPSETRWDWSFGAGGGHYYSEERFVAVTPGVTSVSFTCSGIAAPVVVQTGDQPKYKVTVKLFNSKNYAVRYKLLQGSTTLGETSLGPNSGLIQSFVTTSPDAITVLELVDGLNYDGAHWVAVEGAVYSSPVATATPTLVPRATDPVSETVVPENVNLPDNISPSPAPATAPVWKPKAPSAPVVFPSTTPNNDPAGQVDLVTNAVFKAGVQGLADAIDGGVRDETFRDGVDKIVSEMKGATIEAPAEIVAPVEVDLGESSVATQLLGKLPTAPTVETPGSVTQFSAVVTVPGLQQEFELAFNLQDYPSVSVFRALVLAALSLSFFFLTLKAVKEAFA